MRLTRLVRAGGFWGLICGGLLLSGCGVLTDEAVVAEPVAETSTTEPVQEELSAEETAQLELGKNWYEATCMACHQADGRGQEGLAPPFDPKWLARPAAHQVRMLLHGLRGPIQVGDRVYELEMPGLWVLEDDQLAAALSYVRRNWGTLKDWRVKPEVVTAIRKEYEDRLEPWTVKELDALGESR